MRPKKGKPRIKPWFCYDVNQEFHALVKQCNKSASFISSVRITGDPEAKDQFIIQQCNKKDFHIITRNTIDFKYPAKSIKIGMICVGLKEEEDFIPKFNKLFAKFKKHKDYYYKSINIGDNIIILDRKTKEQKLL